MEVVRRRSKLSRPASQPTEDQSAAARTRGQFRHMLKEFPDVRSSIEETARLAEKYGQPDLAQRLRDLQVQAEKIEHDLSKGAQ